jgi:hypothetical protein
VLSCDKFGGVHEDVYDIEVEKAHNFYCNGYLTHNSAEIAFGDITDTEFLNLKDYSINPERAAFGWTSNNTVFAQEDSNYSSICKKIAVNGEPGVCWLDNVQRYGRMGDAPDGRDGKAILLNPCGEISLESYEVCNLVEVFLNKHNDFQEFIETLKFAYFYAKTVTLVPIHWPDTQEVVRRNRRIGCSLSGVVQFIAAHGVTTLKKWVDEGYRYLRELDGKISSNWNISTSIKLTCIKPSGTISLLAGATPGIHFPIAQYYIRRIRIATSDPLMEYIRQCAFEIEKCAIGTDNYVVSIPIAIGENVPYDKSMWQQLKLIEFMQLYWADNQVSATVTFDASEEEDLVYALQYYKYTLKNIAFLPKNTSSYLQAPYEKITKDMWEKMMIEISERRSKLPHVKTLTVSNIANMDEDPLLYCDSEKCMAL